MDTQRSVSRGFELTPDLLATQGRALRSLARSLLGDAHAAEDVVQETWVTCLRHPEAVPVRISAWLGTVTRRLALRRIRGEKRRDVRERNALVPERAEEAAQRALEREEALRAVTQALLALEEPFKTALLLRYYEDRSPSAIASELGLPLSTVKSRIARGLEKLRGRLGADFRGDEASRRRALCALAGLGPLVPSVAGGAAAAGGVVLGLKLELAAAALFLAGGALWWWQRPVHTGAEHAAQVPPLAESTPGATALARGTAESPAPAAAGESQTQREAVAPAASTPGTVEAFPPEASFRFRLVGRVRDEHDLPLAGASIYLAPHLFPLNRVATTDAEGRFTVAFDGRRPALDVAVAIEGNGAGTELRELHLVSGRDCELDVGLRPPWRVDRNEAQVVVSLPVQSGAEHEAALRYRLEAEDLAQLEAKQLLLTASNVLARRVFRTSGLLLDGAPDAPRRADGRALLVAPPPTQSCAREESRFAARAEFAFAGALEQEVLGLKVAADRSLLLEAVGREAALDLADGIPPEPSPSATIRGVVSNARGEPMADVEVGFGPPRQGLRGSVRSDANGAFALEMDPGEHALRAGGGDDGLAEERITLAGGQDFRWNPVLERGDEVTGRLLDERGSPLAHARLELWSTSPTFVWSDSTTTGADGRFAFPNVPGGALELSVYVGSREGEVAVSVGDEVATMVLGPSLFPERIVRPVFARCDLGDVALPACERARRNVTLRVLGPEDEPLPGTEVRLWREGSPQGRFETGIDEDGRVSLGALPSGSYRVEVGGPFGWRDLGRVWVDGTLAEPLDLGVERFGNPGYVLVSVAEECAPTLSLWSAHADVFGQVAVPLSPRTLVPLAAGDYVLCARDGKKSCEAPLAVRAGETSALCVELSRGELVARATAVDPALVSEKAMACSACHAPAGAVASGQGLEPR